MISSDGEIEIIEWKEDEHGYNLIEVMAWYHQHYKAYVEIDTGCYVYAIIEKGTIKKKKNLELYYIDYDNEEKENEITKSVSFLEYYTIRKNNLAEYDNMKKYCKRIIELHKDDYERYYTDRC